jgi:hypothetical protein
MQAITWQLSQDPRSALEHAPRRSATSSLKQQRGGFAVGVHDRLRRSNTRQPPEKLRQSAFSQLAGQWFNRIRRCSGVWTN